MARIHNDGWLHAAISIDWRGEWTARSRGAAVDGGTTLLCRMGRSITLPSPFPKESDEAFLGRYPCRPSLPRVTDRISNIAVLRVIVNDLCGVILVLLQVLVSVSMCRSEDNGERNPSCDT